MSDLLLSTAANGLALPLSAVVLDTDVVSFVFKRDSRAAIYRKHLEGRRWIISAQTLAELNTWPIRRDWGPQRRIQLDQFLAALAVIHTDDDICRLWGQITARAARNGMSVPATDAWQAATALFLGIPLVTHNARNYQGIEDLQLLSESP
jgi:tRNA(fMet)-specific endonuclease VapC